MEGRWFTLTFFCIFPNYQKLILKAYLIKHVRLKNFGEVMYCLSIHITRRRSFCHWYDDSFTKTSSRMKTCSWYCTWKCSTILVEVNGRFKKRMDWRWKGEIDCFRAAINDHELIISVGPQNSRFLFAVVNFTLFRISQFSQFTSLKDMTVVHYHHLSNYCRHFYCWIVYSDHEIIGHFPNSRNETVRSLYN